MTDYTKDEHALPYPEGGNKVAVHGDIQALAAKTGIAITLSASAARVAAENYTDGVAGSLRTDLTAYADTAAKDAKWSRPALGLGTDLNTLKTPGTHRVDMGNQTSSILNRPPGFSNPFQVEVTELSVSSGVYRQVARMKTSGASTFVEYTRLSLSGVFLAWENTTPLARAALVAGSDLNTLLAPGTYRVELGATVGTILNRPTGFSQPFAVEVQLISETNGIYRQTARMKDTGAGTWQEVSRWSLAGKFYDWMTPTPAAPVFGSTDRDTSLIAIYGDSQSEDAAGTSWPEYANVLLSGTTIVNQARSGDNSWEILTRAGVMRPMFTAEGGSIPASGAVNLKTSQRLQFRADRTIIGGTLAGVGGTLRHVADDNFTFTRSTTGTAVALTTPKPFISSLNTNARTVVFWFGGNDFNADVTGQERSVADHVIGAYRKAVVWAQANGYEPVIAGVTNRLAAVSGSEGFRQVQKVNVTLRRQYPDIFLDVQAYYSERAIYDAGLMPTAADLTAISRGEIPPQLFTDGVHLIPAAHEAIAKRWIAPWLSAKGYAFTTQALSALPALTPKDE